MRILIRKIVKFFTMASDQRERLETNRAVARIGGRPCRPGRSSLFLLHNGIYGKCRPIKNHLLAFRIQNKMQGLATFAAFRESHLLPIGFLP